MNMTLNFFPELTEELTQKMGFLSGFYEFKYRKEGFEHLLEARQAEGHNSSYLQLSDEKNEWVPDEHELIIERKLFIKNPAFLFGVNGIACNDAELGMALIWTSKTSNQRGAIEIGAFVKNSNEEISFKLSHTFPPGHLKGNISFQTVLFLKTPGSAEENETHLANLSGMILGTIDEFIVILEGNGSVFPIVEVKEPSQPLWWVVCDWTDPQADSFDEENVRICLNKSHSNYKLLNLENGIYESPLLMDIIASALHIIILKVKDSEYWDETVNGKNFEAGSISQAVYYFISTFNWDPGSPESLAQSIRKDFDSRIQ
ncbi:hypothetical protein [Metabacillus indicus]|uniref:Uncharacterized protein n=1 Tax=Metabacillus indicus TaxID=246786 RepID=A0A084H257_METID|nr:hypothetical protein [Metabacillus indicus]KEZ53669.1 hypothetical protein GS18_0201440 [Metabacillus indicus]